MLVDLHFNTFFLYLEKKYLYVVICPSDGTYNHLTYFEENDSWRSEPQNAMFAFDVLTPKLPRLIRFTQFKFETNIVECIN